MIRAISIFHLDEMFQKPSNLVLSQKGDQNLQIVFHEVPLVLSRLMF
jgi:hypothetical protein